MHAYEDTDDVIAHTFGRVHGNGEQTHVAIISSGEDSYVAVAYDIDPREFEPVAAECVAYDPTLEGVIKRAKRWMEQNPKGVAYQDGDGEASNSENKILATLKRMAVKLNEYGNQQTEQMQKQQGGNQ